MLILHARKVNGEIFYGDYSVDGNIKENKRLLRVIDSMLTSHSILQERYKLWACILDVVLVVASVLLLVTAFADPEMLKVLKISPSFAIIIERFSSVVVFIVSLIMLRVDWSGKAVSHGKARDSLIRLKGETNAVLLDDSVSKEKLEKHSQLCSVTLGELCPIPERQFNKLKAKHLKKKELSKLISEYPGCPYYFLKIRLCVVRITEACCPQKTNK